MRLQRVGISAAQLGSMVVGPRMCLRDFSLTLQNKLGFTAEEAEDIARFVVEDRDDGDTSERVFDEDQEISKTKFAQRFSRIVTGEGKESYRVFSQAQVEALKKEVRKALCMNKVSLEETIKLDDDDETGVVSLEGIKESFEVMELELGDELMEFIFYWIFRESKNTEEMKYGVLLSLLDEVDDDFEDEAPSPP